jgi:CO dehydrogenase/acetyl-CoA synthase alpha subunit
MTIRKFNQKKKKKKKEEKEKEKKKKKQKTSVGNCVKACEQVAVVPTAFHFRQ